MLLFEQAVTRKCSVEKVFLKNLQNLWEKYLSLRHATLLKKRLKRKCFPVNLTKRLEHLLKTPAMTVSVLKSLSSRCFGLPG